MKRFAERKYRHEPCLSLKEEKDVAEWMDSHFLISCPDEDETLTLDFVEAEMASAALHHGCKVFVLDPWNEISHTRGRRNDTEYIEQALVRLKQKCRRWGLILIIVAHPTKLEDDKKPSLYSISGSANWRNKADHGIIIHRPFEDASQISVTVGKSKDHETMGHPGEVWMEFKPVSCDYEEIKQ
jgi:twinkle protein